MEDNQEKKYNNDQRPVASADLETSGTLDEKYNNDQRAVVSEVMETSGTLDEKYNNDQRPVASEVMETSGTLDEKYNNDQRAVVSADLETSGTLDEKYNKDQRAVANEVLETFGTLVEKLSSAQDITVCSSSVQELLCEDLFDFKDHFQPDLYEEVRVYLTQLQGFEKDRLCRLSRKITTLRCSLQDSEEGLNEMTRKEKETDDYSGFLAMTTKIFQGLIYSNPNGSELTGLVKKMKNHRRQNRDVVEINKIELGKMIRDYTGNEGSNENPDLCRLLQTCLDFLQTESKPIWKNASFTIYDPEENMYKITSGTRRHQFICRMKNGEPFIMKKKKHRQIRNEFPFQCPLL